MNMSKCVSLVVLCFLISACLAYPINKRIQPKATIEVVDEAGEPVRNAEVHLVASSHPHPREEFRMIKKTRNTGLLKFPEIKEWRIESLNIHGIAYYFWHWCVRKNGYETEHTHYGDLSFSKKMKVVLKEGVSSECPEGGLQIIHNKERNEMDGSVEPPIR